MRCNYDFYMQENKKLATIMVKEIRRFALEWTEDYTIYILLNNEVDFFSDGAGLKLKANDAAIINPYTPYSTLSDKKGNLALVLHLSQGLFERYVERSRMPIFRVKTETNESDAPNIRELRAIAARLMLFGVDGAKISRARFEGYLHLAAALLLESFQHDDLPRTHLGDKMNGLFTYEAMVSYIDKNYKEDISLEDVARVGNYNQNYVSQFFKVKAGMNFHDYLTRVRLMNAISELNGTNKSMLDIALESGFTSAKAFTRNFNRMYGMTPSEYKARITSGEFKDIKYIEKRDRQLSRLLTSTATEVSDELREKLMYVANSYDFMIR